MALRTLRICFIVDRRYLHQEMPASVIRVLRTREIAPDILCPHRAHFDPEHGVAHAEHGRVFDLNDYDVIVSRNRNALGLAMLAYAEVSGIRAINTHASTQRIRNKAKMAIRLSQEGMPCAPTILADEIGVLTRLSSAWFPLILKPTYGDNSRGLRLIRRPKDLSDVHWGDNMALAQHYLPNDGFDLKLYVCGRSVFAVRKPSPFNGDPNESSQPVETTSSMTDLALRCGEIFGLEIYGVDTVETPEGPMVIEVNEFPNFTGVPGIGSHIADYILDQAGAQTSRARVPPGLGDLEVLSSRAEGVT